MHNLQRKRVDVGEQVRTGVLVMSLTRASEREKQHVQPCMCVLRSPAYAFCSSVPPWIAHARVDVRIRTPAQAT